MAFRQLSLRTQKKLLLCFQPPSIPSPTPAHWQHAATHCSHILPSTGELRTPETRWRPCLRALGGGSWRRSSAATLGPSSLSNAVKTTMSFNYRFPSRPEAAFLMKNSFNTEKKKSEKGTGLFLDQTRTLLQLIYVIKYKSAALISYSAPRNVGGDL